MEQDARFGLREEKTHPVLELVYTALKEKGYNPAGQLLGCPISGDPAYIKNITSHLEARSLLSSLSREDVLAEIVEFYLKHELANDTGK